MNDRLARIALLGSIAAVPLILLAVARPSISAHPAVLATAEETTPAQTPRDQDYQWKPLAPATAPAAPLPTPVPTPANQEWDRQRELACIQAGSQWVPAHWDNGWGNARQWVEANCRVPRTPSASAREAPDLRVGSPRYQEEQERQRRQQQEDFNRQQEEWRRQQEHQETQQKLDDLRSCQRFGLHC